MAIPEEIVWGEEVVDQGAAQDQGELLDPRRLSLVPDLGAEAFDESGIALVQTPEEELAVLPIGRGKGLMKSSAEEYAEAKEILRNHNRRVKPTNKRLL